MKLLVSYLAIATCALVLQGCGGGSSLGDNKKDTDTLQPIPPEKLPDDRPRPTASIPVITAKKTSGIVDAYGKPILLRGVDIKFGDDPNIGVDAVIAAKAAGANVVRLLINESTTDPQLEGALVKVVENNMVAIVSFTDPRVTCVESDTVLLESVTQLWRKKWLAVLAQDRFQSNLMINIADGWGPNDIFSSNSFGYQGYLDTYKALIRLFRADGFKVPLVIDAPACGEDFNAFLAGRGREMLATDTEGNIILSVQAKGEKWNSNSRLINAVASLNDETVPYVITAFNGSGVGDSPVDHLDIMKEAAGNHALAINIPWVTANDTGAYSIKLSESHDLRGGAAVSFNAFLDNRYFEMQQEVGSERILPKGKLNLVVYIKDANGNRLKLTTLKVADLRPNTWNAIRAEVPKSDIDTAMLMAGATAFDVTQVSDIGIQLLANGQTEKAKGDILFDDVQLWPGVPPMYEANFKSGVDSWASAWNVNLSAAGGALVIAPTSTDNFALNYGVPNSIKMNTIVDFKMRMYLPAEYAGENLWCNLYGKFGDSWKWGSASLGCGALKAGEWNEITGAIDLSASKDDEGNLLNLAAVHELGLQIGGYKAVHTEPIRVDSMTIVDRFAKKMKVVIATQFKSAFTKNEDNFEALDWADAAKTKVEAVNGELVVTPEISVATRAGLRKANIRSINEVDLKGPVTVKFRVFVPASYEGTEFPISLFIQDGATWYWHETAQKSPENLQLGEWNNIEFDFNNLPADFNRGPIPNAFGILFYGTTGLKGASFKIDDLEFIGQTLVDDSVPLFASDFSANADIDAFTVDTGVPALLSESALTQAKKWGYKVAPIGWMANSWAGHKGDEAALNIAASQDVKDPKNITYVLTPRGEDIVNGVFGLKATSVEITLPPVKPK